MQFKKSEIRSLTMIVLDQPPFIIRRNENLQENGELNNLENGELDNESNSSD